MKRWLMVLVLAIVLTMPVGFAVAGAYVSSADIKTGAVNSRTIANGSIRPGDLKQKYYTQAEVDALLVNYAEVQHTHVPRDIHWPESGRTLSTVITELQNKNADLLDRIEALEASATP